MSASTDPRQLSPKVIGVAIAGFIITTLGAGMAAITPQALEGLGVWAFPVASFVATAGGAALAWWRADPLRLNYGAQVAAFERAGAGQYDPPQNVDG